MLHSLDQVRDTTNPYLVLLIRSLPQEVESLLFSWRTAVFGRYDVLHVHWPEHLLGAGGARGLARRVAFAAVLARVRLTRTGVVRTLHNIRPHEGRRGIDAFLLRGFDAATTGTVLLQPSPVPPPGRFVVEIPHGHYRPWFAGLPGAARVEGRLLFFGQIRGYKGVAELLEAFAGVNARAGASLVVCGQPQDDALAQDLTERAARDPRVSLRLGHVADADLSVEVARAELVVLPYKEMHNSGAVLLALSLDRPVLVPRSEHSRALAQEVGAGWVLEYDGPLTAEVLRSGLAQARSTVRSQRPDLDRRDWGGIGAAHAEVYRRARSVLGAHAVLTRSWVRRPSAGR